VTKKTLSNCADKYSIQHINNIYVCTEEYKNCSYWIWS